jgi:hypothetical protein
VQDCANARYVSTHLAQLAIVGKLLSGALHAQAKLRSQQIGQFLLKIACAFPSQFNRCHALASKLPNHKGCTHRQFRSRKGKRLTRQRLSDAIHFVQHLAGLDLRHPVFGISFTLTHTYFCRFVRDRFVREDADPYPATTLDVPRHCSARGFDLTRGQPSSADRLQAKLTEAYATALGRNTFIAALLFLAGCSILPGSRLARPSLRRWCFRRGLSRPWDGGLVPLA